MIANPDSTETCYPTNADLAERLETVSALLLQQGANRFRAEAYHNAAEVLRTLDKPAWQTYLSEGIAGLENIHGIGRTISRAMQQMIRGGKWTLLERLTGSDVAEQAFASVPGIGPKLAKRIHDELHIETLVELQAAAWDGRLESMGGFGEKRIRGIRESLAVRGRAIGGRPEYQAQMFDHDHDVDMTYEIPVSEILDVDDEYRFKAAKKELPRVAPKRMNPTAKAWLPILHAERGFRHYTALFSNTEHAHAMGATHDWVVIYLEDHGNDHQHGRWTVITSQFGRLKGCRIVRGREKECAKFYESHRVPS